ncbi:hypothetical protein ABL78_5428 [Leptomonas seymouri]|uniref:Transmembrane protein n=1 Tax=Leptomonas seymouri TaxID=5684 RepID=A0A0N1PCK3_LEPSE|nr:hypothetical protein ABL78_5428 [Leptomonas seymouri]|eukprot:KPI85508.1 hypothetical protein ABL78_5428 [Leptomonas seymouri]
MPGVLRITLALLALLALLCTAVAHAASQSYVLERRVGDDADWTQIGSFAISRISPQAPARVSTQLRGELSMTSEQREQLATAGFIYYRAYPYQEGRSAPEHPTTVVITPCSLIRGFDAIDSRTVVLNENIRVVAGPNTTLLGLQVSSETNFFHSKMVNGDECDRSVVRELFPTVRLRTKLSMVHPVKASRQVNYEDLKVLIVSENDKQAKKPKVEVRQVRNADGEIVEEEVPVDERSFLQKYWMYLVLPIVMSVIQNLKG